MKILYNAKTIKQGHLNLLLYYVTVKFSTNFELRLRELRFWLFTFPRKLIQSTDDRLNFNLSKKINKEA